MLTEPEKAGYTFSGWSSTILTMPANDVEITGSFSANENTAYKVEHYTEDLDGKGYSLAKTDELTGTTDTTATATAATITGFTYEENNKSNVKSGNIAGNGSLVLKLYYSRNSYAVNYKVDGAAYGEADLVKYEDTLPARLAPTKAGYTFSGWSEGPATMPAEAVEITGSFSANTDTAYVVKYYLQNIEDDEYTEDEDVKVEGEGTTDTNATAVVSAPTGFHFNEEESTVTGNIAGDGSLVLNVYYDRDEYTITWMNEDGIETIDTTTVRYGATPAYDEQTKDEDYYYTYTFSGWTPDITEATEDAIYTATFTPVIKQQKVYNFMPLPMQVLRSTSS